MIALRLGILNLSVLSKPPTFDSFLITLLTGQRIRMAKRQLTLASPEKKRVKDPNCVPEGELRAIVADELKMHLSLIRELFKEEFAPIAERLGGLEEDVRRIRNNFDNMQAALRNAKKDTVEIKLAVDSLQEKLARIEDKSRQSNIRLVGLKEGVEGDDPLRFIQNQLPKWIPSLAGKVMEIERAHRIYSGERPKTTPRTFIFKLLRYQDRNAILNEARAAGQILHMGTLLLFFPDYSTHTSAKRRAMSSARKKLTQLGITSFLLYPAVVKVTHRGKISLLETPAEVEKFALNLDPAVKSSLKGAVSAASRESEVNEDESAVPMEDLTEKI